MPGAPTNWPWRPGGRSDPKTTNGLKFWAFLEAANGLGKVISPLAGAAIGLIAWYMPFFVYGILALPYCPRHLRYCARSKIRPKSATPYLLLHQSSPDSKGERGQSRGGLPLWPHRSLFLIRAVKSFFSDLLEKSFHLQIFQRGLVIAVPVLAMAITSYVFGIVLKQQMVKIMKWAIIGGLSLVALGLFFFPLGNGMVTKTIFATLIGTGTGMALPALNTLITSSAPSSERGLVTCLYGTVRFLGLPSGRPSSACHQIRPAPHLLE